MSAKNVSIFWTASRLLVREDKSNDQGRRLYITVSSTTCYKKQLISLHTPQELQNEWKRNNFIMFNGSSSFISIKSPRYSVYCPRLKAIPYLPFVFDWEDVFVWYHGVHEKCFHCTLLYLCYPFIPLHAISWANAFQETSCSTIRPLNYEDLRVIFKEKNW